MSGSETLQPVRLWRDYLKGIVAPADDADNRVIGLAASFTADSLVPHLGGNLLLREPLKLQIIPSPYNQIFQTCINPQRAFEGHTPDTLVILWRLEDMFPALLDRDLTADAAALESLYTELDKLAAAIATLRQKFSGTLIVSTPPYPSTARFELAELHQANRAGSVYAALLGHWLQALAKIERIQVFDLHGLLMEQGYKLSSDARKWYLYRQPYTDPLLGRLGAQLARIIEAQTRSRKKCVVIDCDNTLWGGILGEDGVQGIELGEDFPGSGYRDFQKSLLCLKDAGIFLTIASKNNPEDVDEVFAQNDAMVLTKDDISVFQVHWRSKVESIVAIAKELNIGLDSIVFVDDSGKEIGEVRERLPEVSCLLVPEELAELPDLLRGTDLFDAAEYTAEDRERVAMMATEQQRADFSTDLSEDEFLESLELRVDVFEAEPRHMARVTQLINKTNQFNLTTIRRTGDEVAAIATDANAKVMAMEVGDRFGDYGLVGVAVLQRANNTAWDIDTLLMSCRVLGRGVETAFIAMLVDTLRQSGATSIAGRYLPTKKNQQVEGLYAAHGFSQGDNAGEWHASPGDVSQAPEYVHTSLKLADA